MSSTLMILGGYLAGSDGNLYAMTGNDYFVIDVKTGKVVNQKTVLHELRQNDILTSTGYISVSDDYVFLFDNAVIKSTIAAMDKKTGKITWKSILDGNVSVPNAPIITEN